MITSQPNVRPTTSRPQALELLGKSITSLKESSVMQNEALKEAISSPRISSPRVKPIVNIRTSAKHFVTEGHPYNSKSTTYITEVLTVLGRRELESQQKTVLLGNVKSL